MPRGDRTGPFGEGPMTGRAMGYCAGYDMPGFGVPGRGLGRRGRGLGWGAGWRVRGGYGNPWPRRWGGYYDYPEEWQPLPRPSSRVRADRVADLEARAERLERQLEDIRGTLEQLRSDGQ